VAFSTTIVPTIGRASLARAVESVLDQRFERDAFEVVVVNDSERPLPAEPWQRSPRVRTVDTRGRERAAARNAGAAVARGTYLHFLDDDDMLVPGALEAMWALSRRAPDAVWLCGAWQTRDRHERPVSEFRPGLQGSAFPLLVAGESLALQASFVRADAFRRTGGFDCRAELTGVEDREWGRRLAADGVVASTDEHVAIVHIGEAGSTTNWSQLPLRDRLGREVVLARPDTLGRLLKASLDGYWRGRLTRAYLGSAGLNAARRRGGTAARRTVQALRLGLAHALETRFWHGLRAKPE
jgi:GT2 family glycosyltransferase